MQKLDDLEDQINNSAVLTSEQKEALISRINTIRGLLSKTVRIHLQLDIEIDSETKLNSDQLVEFLGKHTILEPSGIKTPNSGNNDFNPVWPKTGEKATWSSMSIGSFSELQSSFF